MPKPQKYVQTCRNAGASLGSPGEDRGVTDIDETEHADTEGHGLPARAPAAAKPRRRRVPASDPAAGPALPAALARSPRRRGASSRTIARVFEADLSAPV